MYGAWRRARWLLGNETQLISNAPECECYRRGHKQKDGGVLMNGENLPFFLFSCDYGISCHRSTWSQEAGMLKFPDIFGSILYWVSGSAGGWRCYWNAPNNLPQLRPVIPKNLSSSVNLTVCACAEVKKPTYRWFKRCVEKVRGVLRMSCFSTCQGFKSGVYVWDWLGRRRL